MLQETIKANPQWAQTEHLRATEASIPVPDYRVDRNSRHLEYEECEDRRIRNDYRNSRCRSRSVSRPSPWYYRSDSVDRDPRCSKRKVHGSRSVDRDF